MKKKQYFFMCPKQDINNIKYTLNEKCIVIKSIDSDAIFVTNLINNKTYKISISLI